MDFEKKVIYRKILLQDKWYYEFLFVPHKNILILPIKIPSKYMSRIINIQNNYVEVISTKNNVLLVSKHSLLNSDGIWLLGNDCIGKGGIEQIHNVTQFMSIPINLKDAQIVQEFNKSLEQLNVYSLYHGTHVKNIQSILRDGLDETYGMLGNGVYLGTFWKASRFACFSQTYEKQDGAIFRVIVHGSIQNLPLENWKCECCDNIIADHASKWKTNYNGICANPTKTNLINKDGKPKYLLRNEEWCVQKQNVQLSHYALIQSSNYQYDPLCRKIQIK